METVRRGLTTYTCQKCFAQYRLKSQLNLLHQVIQTSAQESTLKDCGMIQEVISHDYLVYAASGWVAKALWNATNVEQV